MSIQATMDRGLFLSRQKREIENELRSIRQELCQLADCGQFECGKDGLCTIKTLEPIPSLKEIDQDRLIAIIGQENFNLVTCFDIKWSEYKNAPFFVKQAISSLSKEMRGGGKSISFK